MPGFRQTPSLPASLSPDEVWYVRVCSFTFQFETREQLQACLDYYMRKTHPSSRIPKHVIDGGDHWEFQRWFEKLPMYLLEEPKRKKVIAALEQAVQQWN